MAGVGKAPIENPDIVIVGAGFGGLACARALAGVAANVTVIDRHNYHLFQPLLYQVATAALSPAEIAVPIRSIFRRWRNVTVLLDEVVSIDMVTRSVLTRDDATRRYDYLVLATGSEYSYFGHDDWKALAPGLKTLTDATEIRSRILAAFERAETCPRVAGRERLLTFVLVGGGPTGVELAGAIVELARAALARDFRNIDPKSARIMLVEAGPRLLPGYAPELSDYTRRTLEAMGVEVRLNAPVAGIARGRVTVRGESVPAATVLWCAGVKASPAARWLGAEAARNGAVKVTADLSVPGHPDIFVIGDSASLAGPDGNPLPGVAPVAKQEGEYVGRLIRSRIEGTEPPGRFVYHDKGSLATIGRSAAVADFGRVRLRGTPAWLLWGAAHIYYLIGFRNRLRVFLNWVWAWLTYKPGARLITREPSELCGLAALCQGEEEPGVTTRRERPPRRRLPIRP